MNLQQLMLPILMFGALALMMYFSVRRQKAAAAKMREMQDSIAPGVRVMTTSGVYGTVVALADDTIELELAPGVNTTWLRAAVREVINPPAAELAPETGEVSLDKGDSTPRDIG